MPANLVPGEDPLPGLPGGCLLAVSSHDLESVSELPGASYKGTN